ncbi:DUF5590 domain-containing protein [Halalkalibacter urbisdiaboli]|uniref:cell wall elongation regulator TseB-like domain-containing protein n=1 Tax=Halalkalibacter urbisdiaboli TaxID=1960589 RepID=UPI000B454D48|nr:DUF5590 domain-containing protein [Halalkalibacter urbisdiaboli]
MKKWFMVTSISFVLLLLGASVLSYYVVRAPLEKGYEQAEKYVLNQEVLHEINTIHYYHGTDPYYILYGLNEELEETIVWLRQDFEEVVSRKASEGITTEEVINKVKDDLGIPTVQKVRLGFERGLPVYEVVFIDEDNRQGYYYITFDDGTFMKRYSLRREI